MVALPVAECPLEVPPGEVTGTSSRGARAHTAVKARTVTPLLVRVNRRRRGRPPSDTTVGDRVGHPRVPQFTGLDVEVAGYRVAWSRADAAPRLEGAVPATAAEKVPDPVSTQPRPAGALPPAFGKDLVDEPLDPVDPVAGAMGLVVRFPDADVVAGCWLSPISTPAPVSARIRPSATAALARRARSRRCLRTMPSRTAADGRSESSPSRR